MLLPKFLYNPLSGTVGSTAVLANVVTVVVLNNLLVGEVIQMVGLTNHTELNYQSLTVLSASGTQFTAAWTHTNYTTAAETGGIVYRCLVPTYPPVAKPGADDREAARTDTVTGAGIVQFIWQRTDIFKNLQFDFVPITDIPVWSKFIDYAIQGYSFSYFTDQTDSNSLTVYTLEDTKWQPKLAFRGMSKFALRLRQYVS